MWDIKKFDSVLKRLKILAEKHFKIYGIETIFFDDGDFSLHAFCNEFPIDFNYDDINLLNITKMRHQIHWHKKENVFGMQTCYDGFNVIGSTNKLLKENEKID